MLMRPAPARRITFRKSCTAFRCISTELSGLSTDETRIQLRQMLRETAQSVAVVTSIIPCSTGDTNKPQSHRNTRETFHGATLSSFTSISLDPFPLVAFSLRIPSRMATALNTRVHRQAECASVSPHLVINVLSAAQGDVAEIFARADLYPRPFEDDRVRWTKSEDGLPILSDSLGALSCNLVGPSLSLADLSWLRRSRIPEGSGRGGDCGPASELFIARVLRVESIPALDSQANEGGDESRTLPLLYHRRQYATVRDIPKSR
ncbi:flavin reductase like domain-containing protein [Phlebopus sp. FC_14]|nr:flavin reductase like domain-containing protein [Phlebopus sp. FC_14]